MKWTNIVLAIERSRTGKRCNKNLQKYAEFKVATNCHNETVLQCKDSYVKSTFSIAFSQDSSKIASSHGDHTVKVFDIRTGKLLSTLKGHPRTPWCLTFHPYLNSIIASGCLSGQIRIWDLSNGSNQHYDITGCNVIASLAFHPTDDILAVASGNTLLMLNWKTGNVLHRFFSASRQEGIRIVKFGPFGSWMITGIMNKKYTTYIEQELTEQQTESSATSAAQVDQRNTYSDYSTDQRSNTIRVPALTRRAVAFAANDEGTYRLQFWDLVRSGLPDLTNDEKGVIVPSCKLINDGNIDVSKDGSLLAALESHGCPYLKSISVISLRKETFGQCMFRRSSCGFNVISLSFSPLNGYLLVGLGSNRTFISPEAEQHIGQVFELPEVSKVTRPAEGKATLALLPPRNPAYNGASFSINAMKFHPTPGGGLFYGDNHGGVTHCRIGDRIDSEKADIL